MSENVSNTTIDETNLYPTALIIPVTIIYALIFITGTIGNISTCIVIARNKPLHTATNYYLFSLAISDLLLLASGLPPETYRLWSPDTYVFGSTFCVLQGLAAETSANATVLTITAFTVERYVAICHPFRAHTMSTLRRAVRFVAAVWLGALCLAAPQAILFGVQYERRGERWSSRCTVVKDYFAHAFEISTCLIFVGPMTVITVLYVLIGVKLRRSKRLAVVAKRGSLGSGAGGGEGGQRGVAAQNRVINMLIAVVAAFFICWAPFHAQRLLAVYLTSVQTPKESILHTIYMILEYTSGILYFLSTTINPVLYHIMSNKFREAFQLTITATCLRSKKKKHPPTYSILARYPPSLRHLQRSVSDSVDRCAVAETALRAAPAAPKPPLRAGSTRSTLVAAAPAEAPPPAGERHLGVLRVCMLHLFSARAARPAARRGSVESGQTISNSSLQDVDEIDYSSSDLVRYMEEVNEGMA